MRALLDDVAGTHDQNQIGVDDGREPVRDHKARAPAHERLHRPADRLLGARVDARGGLVQNEDPRVVEQHARDGEQLALALADVLGVVGNARVVALWERAHKVVDLRGAGRSLHLVARGALAAIGDVLGDRAVKEPRVLQHHTKVPPELAAVHLARVHTIERDAPAVDLVKAHEQVDERGLARARGAHDGDLLPRLGRKRNVAHERLVGRIAKAHVLELNTAADRRGHMRRHLGLRIGLDLGLVEQVEHALNARERALQRINGVAHLRERLR